MNGKTQGLGTAIAGLLTPEHFFRQLDPSRLDNGQMTSGLDAVNCLEDVATDAEAGRVEGGRDAAEEITPTACPIAVADIATELNIGALNPGAIV